MFPLTVYVAIMEGQGVSKPHDDYGRTVDDTIHPFPSHGQGESVLTGTKTFSDTVVDDAANYLANTSQFAPLAPEREKRLLRKIDSWMIPLVRRPLDVEDY